MTEVMLEVFRVLKPGAHGLVWAIPRTSHWTAMALENAGFEIRDVVTHLFGSGFPKSHNIGNKLLGWKGFGTALKPASEHWILIRKPCSEKTVARNVERWGTGAINIDGSRIPSEPIKTVQGGKKINGGSYIKNEDNEDRRQVFENTTGRFPANLLLSHSDECEKDICCLFCPVRLLDEQSGFLHGAGNKSIKNRADKQKSKSVFGNLSGPSSVKDRGGHASRFFYCAKASKKDRGLDNRHPTVKSSRLMEYLSTLITPPKGKILDPFMGSGSTGIAAKRLGFEFTGIEQNEEYFKIAEKRNA